MTVRNVFTVGAVLAGLATMVAPHVANATTSVTNSFTTFAAAITAAGQSTVQSTNPVTSNPVTTGGAIPLTSGNSLTLGSNSSTTSLTPQIFSGSAFSATSFGLAGFSPGGEIFVDTSNAGKIVINFSTAVSSFGLFMEPLASGSTYTTKAWNTTNATGTALASVSTVAASNTSSTFIGYYGTDLIKSININYTPSANTIAIGDFVEAVPEPASLTILGAGLFGLGFARRKRSAI